MPNLLLVDCNFMCRRAQYTTGELDNGVIFGFLRDISILQERFQDHRPVFCFDAGGSKREEIFPGYKASRKKMRHSYSKFDQENESRFFQQLFDLREKWLFEIGYRNVFGHAGFEADDLIARICQEDPGDKVIIGSDRDFFQLLCRSVKMWDPTQNRMFTSGWFKTEFGIVPRLWIEVKCLAGCNTDNIPGVQGVGKATAIKYLRSEVKAGSVAWNKIQHAKQQTEENKILVKLPFPGTPQCPIVVDEVTDKRWGKMIDSLGLESLRGEVPGMRRRRATNA